ASRLFAGHEHEQEVKRLGAHFQKGVDYYQTVEWNSAFFNEMREAGTSSLQSFSKIDLIEFKIYEEAYHHLMWNIVEQQVRSTNLVLRGTSVKKIFVDGGFGKNKIYMTMLAKGFPELAIYAATISQASALGAALAIHKN